MTTIALPNVLKTVDAQSHDFHNIRRKGLFSTKMMDGTAGQPMLLTRENALEFAFYLALARVGVEPVSAGTTVAKLLRFVKQSSDAVDHIWVFNPTRERGKPAPRWGFGDILKKDVPLGILMKGLADKIESGFRHDPESHSPMISASSFAVVDIGAVIDRIDRATSASSDGK